MKALQENLTNMLTNNEQVVEVDTRFGKLKINLDKQINFPEGILGFENFTQFCLAEYPNTAFSQFKILQSIQNYDLSFLILPLADYNNFDRLYDLNDLNEAGKKYNINIKNIVLISMVSINRANENSTAQVFINMRAPILIDIEHYKGYQHVLLNKKYQIKHQIELGFTEIK
ncbi:flagellar assembly protein FliW [Rickettsiales endosymbiont of Stachyamoeba lipophora]|uniref:flagellar assembly protein FliW n=1 Tax=Rickettsiales endosymbiont of Stachyamoeba lipophora TaxID=2486578 RepID=UPI000F648D44|nr:flagellar assembly protein FliW [Rickettsiales endosymbiont of Stachyamoeba lipophora]AZL16193.1 hypothetical protein EF513_06585 [Rickettsiales endosymbiont of Stachyamoeba lipophora]